MSFVRDELKLSEDRTTFSTLQKQKVSYLPTQINLDIDERHSMTK